MHIPNIQYPKLSVLLLSFLLTFFLEAEGFFEGVIQAFQGYEYLTIFVGGFFFSFGFTTAAGIAMFIEASPYVSAVPAAVIAGFGATMMDQVILQVVKVSFQDEFDRLRETTFMHKISAFFHQERISEKVREYMLWCFAGLIIASPLPDEMGITLVSGMHNIERKRFAALCFLMNTIGIFLIILASQAVA